MDSLADLLDDRSFQAAVAYSGIGFVVITVVASVRVWGRRPPLGGFVLVAATLAALGGLGPAKSVGNLPPELFIGLGVLAATGIALEWFRPPLVVTMAALLPGAWIVGLALDGVGPDWSRPLLVTFTAIGGALVADTDRYQERRGFGPALLAITIVGVYGTVPDTEHARVLLGAALPLLFLGIPTPVAKLGVGGSATSVALIMWIATVDGVGRPAAIVGSAGAFAILLAEPLGRRAFSRLRQKVRRKNHTLARHLVVVTDVTLLHAVLALYASRVAGFSDTTAAAVWLLVPMLAVAFVAAGTFPPPPRPRKARPRRGHGIVLDR
ncbi:MAG TPA: hypothetical protein VFZ83_14515 [Acidimicrobiia bacterium]|nr:hypothetical protein [Acidimicrobiia bacterium]